MPRTRTTTSRSAVNGCTSAPPANRSTSSTMTPRDTGRPAGRICTTLRAWPTRSSTSTCSASRSSPPSTARTSYVHDMNIAYAELAGTSQAVRAGHRRGRPHRAAHRAVRPLPGRGGGFPEAPVLHLWRLSHRLAPALWQGQRRGAGQDRRTGPDRRYRRRAPGRCHRAGRAGGSAGAELSPRRWPAWR